MVISSVGNIVKIRKIAAKSPGIPAEDFPLEKPQFLVV